jgi:phosphoribosylamine--glycine ligase / phosphoribosylformylglycinamidine cyclo-ligase
MLFTGVMNTTYGPKVLEYNCRFGDPETQFIMLLLNESTDLADILLSCTERRLCKGKIGIKTGFAVNVVVAAGGYPEE